MEYIYKYKDHLGNVRMYFVKIPGKPGSLITREAGIKEENYLILIYLNVPITKNPTSCWICV